MSKSIAGMVAVVVVLMGVSTAQAQSITSSPTSVLYRDGTKDVTPKGTFSPGANYGAIDIQLEVGYLVNGVFTSWNPPVTQGIGNLNPNLTYQGVTWHLTPAPGVSYVVRAKLYGYKRNDPMPQRILLATADGPIP